jgi:tRNA/rRNA methyltransferase
MALADCRVVLVRPEVPGNLGATARVMRNMGLAELVLVAPAADPADSRARRLSTHGEAILRQARRVPDLDTAVADCLLVVGTSARVGGLVRGLAAGPPRAVMPRLAEVLADGPAALVFGPERTGLTNAEVVRCHELVHVPTDPAYLSLNLAQAVAICLYELRAAWLDRGGEPAAAEPPAPFAEQERMFGRLREALEAIHFLYGPKADALMHALRHLLVRARPTRREVELLFGLARQVRWFADNRPGPAAGSED